MKNQKRLITTDDYKVKEYTENDELQFSYSKLNLFKTCPGQYAFRYLTDLDIKPTIWPGNLYGYTIHSALEDSLKLKLNGVQYEDILESLEDTFEKKYLIEAKKQKKHYKESAELKRNKKKFFKSGQDDAFRVVKFVLKYFNDVLIVPEREHLVKWDWIKNISVTGVLDMELRFPNENINIFDLKITKDGSNFFFIDWNKNIQKIMYEYFMYKEFKKMPEGFGYLILDRDNKVLFLKESDIAIEHNPKKHFFWLNEQIKEIYNFSLNPTLDLCKPDKSKCYWCVYKKICDYKYNSKLSSRLKSKR